MSIKTNMNNISFKSTIRPVSPEAFNKAITSYGKKNFIAYPWTVKESIISDKIYTKGVEDCSFFALTDGIKALGMHLCPTMEANFDFSKIKEFIEKSINLKDSNLQGFILGGRRHSEDNGSFRLFENLENILKTNKIPYSKFKGGAHVNDIAYDSSKDEFLVSTVFAQNENIKRNYEAKEVLSRVFDETEVSELDDICW